MTREEIHAEYADIRMRIRSEHAAIEQLLAGYDVDELPQISRELSAHRFALQAHHKRVADLAAKCATETA